jgi:ribosome-associated protein
MDIRKLQRAIVDGLEDVKAQQIAVFNTEHLSSMFERVIIASGASNRQTRALASSVRTAVKAAGLQVLRTEGEDNGEWIIVDCGAAVVHVMQPAIREYYHLEEIWGGKAVKMKMGGQGAGLVKASEPEPEPEPARERAAPKRRAAATPGARSATPRPAARAVTKAPVKTPVKAPAKSVAKSGKLADTKAATKPAAKIKTLVVGKPVARKTAAKAAPARKKAVARKGPVTKVASRR